jgi:hypothetical protein
VSDLLENRSDAMSHSSGLRVIANHAVDHEYRASSSSDPERQALHGPVIEGHDDGRTADHTPHWTDRAQDRRQLTQRAEAVERAGQLHVEAAKAHVRREACAIETLFEDPIHQHDRDGTARRRELRKQDPCGFEVLTVLGQDQDRSPPRTIRAGLRGHRPETIIRPMQDGRALGTPL